MAITSARATLSDLLLYSATMALLQKYQPTV